MNATSSHPTPPSPAPLAVRVRRAIAMAAFLLVLAGLLYARAVPCVFAEIFRLPCPGCGSTRAVLALLHGDMGGVLRYNPMGPVMAVLLFALGAQSFVSVLMHGDFRDAGEGRLGLVIKRGVFVVVGLQLVLWVARFFGVLGGPVPV